MEKIGTYNKHTHTEDDCDKCAKRVGKENLFVVPFLYKDMNDLVHEDLGNGYTNSMIAKEVGTSSGNMWAVKKKFNLN